MREDPWKRGVLIFKRKKWDLKKHKIQSKKKKSTTINQSSPSFVDPSSLFPRPRQSLFFFPTVGAKIFDDLVCTRPLTLTLFFTEFWSLLGSFWRGVDRRSCRGFIPRSIFTCVVPGTWTKGFNRVFYSFLSDCKGGVGLWQVAHTNLWRVGCVWKRVPKVILSYYVFFWVIRTSQTPLVLKEDFSQSLRILRKRGVFNVFILYCDFFFKTFKLSSEVLYQIGNYSGERKGQPQLEPLLRTLSVYSGLKRWPVTLPT